MFTCDPTTVADVNNWHCVRPSFFHFHPASNSTHQSSRTLPPNLTRTPASNHCLLQYEWGVWYRVWYQDWKLWSWRALSWSHACLCRL